MARSVRVSPNPVTALIQPVIQSLLSSERETINKRINAILTENKALGGTHGAYTFEGKFYSISPRRAFKGIVVRSVATALEKRAKSIVNQIDELKVSEQRLTHSFAVIARLCKNAQDLRDALPDTLVSEIPFLKHMDRIRSEGEILADRPAILQQYQRAVDIALQIIGKRLIHG
jgi:hypothetical protein